MKVKDIVTADQIVQGAKAPKTSLRKKVPFYSLRLKKERSASYVVDSVRGEDDLVAIARSELGHVPHEEMIAVGLDGGNHILGVVRVSQGGLGSTAIVSSDVIRPLITMGARAFVVAHNHPSGDPTPSRNDYVMTDRLKKASECIDLNMLDHIVVAGRGGGFRSIMNRYATGTFVDREG